MRLTKRSRKNLKFTVEDKEIEGVQGLKYIVKTQDEQ